MRKPTINPKDKRFDWLKALEWIMKNDTALTKIDHRRLHSAASRWPTCACGQLCKKLPRSDGEPHDGKLFEFGCRFASYVTTRQWAESLSIFHQIEARTAKLLKANL